MLLLTCTPSISVLFFLSFPTLIKHFFPSPWYSADVVRRSSSTAVLFRFWQRMLTSRCDEKTGGVPTIHHTATRNVFFRVKKKRKGKVKILPNALLHNAGAKHDDVQQDTTPEKLPPLEEWKLHILVCTNQNDSLCRELCFWLILNKAVLDSLPSCCCCYGS